MRKKALKPVTLVASAAVLPFTLSPVCAAVDSSAIQSPWTLKDASEPLRGGTEEGDGGDKTMLADICW